MNIIISCAGLGTRFKERGFKRPKHLIKINQKTLIEHAIESLNIEGNYYFIIREDSENELKLILKKLKPNCKIIEIDYVTEGPASSCYLVKDFIDREKELIITNCDQILEYDSMRFLNETRHLELDCSVLTYSSEDKKNSFIKYVNGNTLEIKEKEVISNTALVGVHYFKKTSYFLDTYEEIYKQNIRAENGEFYLSTICNYMISNYKVGGIHLLENEHYYSTGTPNCYFDYLKKKNLSTIQLFKMSDMFNGWFIGNFEPSVLKTDQFEVGYLFHKKDEKWPVHYHEKLTEINVLIKGKMILNDILITENTIFTIHKNDIACPIFLEDCSILCIKIPSVFGDKVII